MNHDPAIPPRPTEGVPPVETLPEQLAAKAGMPRTESVEHSLHTASDRATAAGRDANARLQQGLHDTTREAAEQASNLRDRAADKASELRDQAADKASELRDRASETLRSARARAEDTYEDARAWAEDRYDSQRRRAADLADRGAERLHRGRTATEDFIAENPLLVGVVGLAAGLLLGALLPRTRQEDRALGPYADDLRGQGVRYARDLTQRGRTFVETALDPDNIDAAVQRAAGTTPERDDHDDAERTAHRL
ncbi:hypothetical protein [Methylorubrum sp. SB2]|uniref:hypothetical protein n=1 Tax=Methylorubrum subtropicum TaxID=3138812 RepID=UPI00313BB9CD